MTPFRLSLSYNMTYVISEPLVALCSTLTGCGCRVAPPPACPSRAVGQYPKPGNSDGFPDRQGPCTDVSGSFYHLKGEREPGRCAGFVGRGGVRCPPHLSTPPTDSASDFVARLTDGPEKGAAC